jgi:hypothetical protein
MPITLNEKIISSASLKTNKERSRAAPNIDAAVSWGSHLEGVARWVFIGIIIA